MKNLVILGATNIDIIAKSYNPIVISTKNPGNTTISYGGVARNICENLAKLKMQPTFITVIGNDQLGINAMKYLDQLNVTTIYEKLDNNTPTFLSILNDNGDNYISISSMDAINSFNSQKPIDFNNYDLIVLDANIKQFINTVSTINKQIFVDATSEAKCINILNILDKISYLKCTKEELKTLFKTTNIEIIINTYPSLTLIVTNSDNNITYNIDKQIFTSQVEKTKAINSIGAGDSFSAGIIYGLCKNYDLHKCIEIAKTIAKETVLHNETVNPNLNLTLIKGVETYE